LAVARIVARTGRERGREDFIVVTLRDEDGDGGREGRKGKR